MKEKITEILKKYEDIELAYQYDVATEEEALKNKATPESIADEIMRLVNQEVEKRIADRMPSDEERHIAASEYEHKESMGYSEMDKLTGLYRNIDFEAGADWACSRLTNPGVNDSQKTEGGGE